MKPQLLSGARGKIEFSDSAGNKTLLGFVTDVSITVAEGLRPSYVIGNIGPVTIEPLSTDVNCSIGRIIPINAREAAAGQPPAALAQIDGIDHGLEERINEILSSDHVEITVYDTNPSDGKDYVYGSVKFARFAGRSTNTNTGDFTTERYNFVGLWDGSYGNVNTSTDINYGFDS